jgi:outer membrane protein OmpA-like peptidoglycan-associated protein
MNPITYLITVACAALIVGCAASVPPPELINARQAYARASAGQAAQLVPAELHKAQVALTIAEKSFQSDPKSFQTRDLAYVADRKAKMAEALATTAAGNAATAKANKDFEAAQTQIVKNAKEDLAASEAKVATEKQARLEAEKRAARAQADLARLAAVKEEERGLVITLSGSVLFASGKSALLPAAQNRLNQVADALLATKERRLTVEGHTDAQGSSNYNQVLSQKRADAVRSYIISRGYPADLIHAQGIGEDRPVSNNANAEGRANNRRVEIIIDRTERAAN